MMLLLILFYTVSNALLPSTLSNQGTLSLYFFHALLWTLFHTFGLGCLLRAQSEKKFLVRHFIKHYHYPENDKGTGAVQEAFTNWKCIYNLSMCMTYGENEGAPLHIVGAQRGIFSWKKLMSLSCLAVSFVGLVWKTYSFPSEWAVGNELLRHTLGVVSYKHHS